MSEQDKCPNCSRPLGSKCPHCGEDQFCDYCGACRLGCRPKPEETMLDLKIEDIKAGLRNYGYRVTSEPIPGEEQAYYEHLRQGMLKIDETVAWAHKQFRCRNLSKRTLEILHRWLPEPCWGVESSS